MNPVSVLVSALGTLLVVAGCVPRKTESSALTEAASAEFPEVPACQNQPDTPPVMSLDDWHKAGVEAFDHALNRKWVRDDPQSWAKFEAFQVWHACQTLTAIRQISPSEWEKRGKRRWEEVQSASFNQLLAEPEIKQLLASLNGRVAFLGDDEMHDRWKERIATFLKSGGLSFVHPEEKQEFLAILEDVKGSKKILQGSFYLSAFDFMVRDHRHLEKRYSKGAKEKLSDVFSSLWGQMSGSLLTDRIEKQESFFQALGAVLSELDGTQPLTLSGVVFHRRELKLEKPFFVRDRDGSAKKVPWRLIPMIGLFSLRELLTMRAGPFFPLGIETGLMGSGGTQVVDNRRMGPAALSNHDRLHGEDMAHADIASLLAGADGKARSDLFPSRLKERRDFLAFLLQKIDSVENKTEVESHEAVLFCALHEVSLSSIPEIHTRKPYGLGDVHSRWGGLYDSAYYPPHPEFLSKGRWEEKTACQENVLDVLAIDRATATSRRETLQAWTREYCIDHPGRCDDAKFFPR